MFEALHNFLSSIAGSITPANPAGLTALWGIAMLVEIGIPIPFVIETLLFFTSYNLSPLSIQVMMILVLSLAGRETGAAALYWLSRLIGAPFLNWVRRRSKALSRKMDQFQQRLGRRAVVTVATIRLTPGLMQVPSLVGGTMRLRYLNFSLGVAVSSLIYDLVMVGLGFAARSGLQGVEARLRIYIIITVIIVMVVMWLVMWLAFQRR